MVYRGKRIATNHLNDELGRSVDFKGKYDVSPAGRRLSEEFPFELNPEPGRRVLFTATASGRYHTHRLLLLNLLKDGQWMHHVAVDLDDNKVVQTRWTPTAEDMASAREIADPQISDFLGHTQAERTSVKVKGSGEYDFGPTRRLLILTYTKPENFSSSLLKFVTVDMDAVERSNR